MRGNDFVLNFVGTFLALVLLVVSAVIFSLIDLGLNLRNRLVRMSAHLLDVACPRELGQRKGAAAGCGCTYPWLDRSSHLHRRGPLRVP